MLILAVWIAHSWRLDRLHAPIGGEWVPYLLSPLMAVPCFAYFGLYRTIYRFSGMATLVAVVQAVFVYGMLYAIVLLSFRFPDVPRSLGFMQPVLTLMLIGGWRLAVRVWFGRGGGRGAMAPRRHALIYGAGSAGTRLAAALRNSPEIRVCGYLDDDKALRGQSINGITIHAPADLHRVVDSEDVTEILLAIPSLDRARRNRILDELRPSGLHVRTLPDLMGLTQGRVLATDLRELEIEDLLSREPVQPDALLMSRYTTGCTVLVTGAGGSIGSELCRQILLVQPKRLLLVEQSEFALYSIHRELTDKLLHAQLPPCELVPLLCSVRDEARMIAVMRAMRPDIVYHAAAYKHVPLVEHNLAEGVRNNVIGTWVAARAAQRCGVPAFVFVSTDKAVRPTNVMGATKRLAEMVLQAMAAAQPDGPTRYSMVRFGNVLGSSGSVVPLFRQQIANGGPITLTHAEVTRYFMTIPEAAQLVVQAGAMADSGDLFVLDMGEPVRIVDLARRMVELSGLRVRDEDWPDGDIEIVVTGLRPGEKLYEELLIGDNPLPTEHARIMKARESFTPWEQLLPELQVLERMADGAGQVQLRSQLRKLVVGFQPSSELVDWLQTDPGPLEQLGAVPLRRDRAA